jgi:hypothetical protein
MIYMVAAQEEDNNSKLQRHISYAYKKIWARLEFVTKSESTKDRYCMGSHDNSTSDHMDQY